MVLRIEPLRRVVGSRGHLIRIGEHDDTMKGFKLPTMLHQFHCQPIKKLRMRRRGPHHTEIILGGDDAVAEVMLPYSIDDDARRQWMFSGGQPPRELQSAARGMSSRLGRRGRTVHQ